MHELCTCKWATLILTQLVFLMAAKPATKPTEPSGDEDEAPAGGKIRSLRAIHGRFLVAGYVWPPGEGRKAG